MLLLQLYSIKCYKVIFLNNIIQGYSEGTVSKSEIVFYDQSCCLSSIYLNQLIKTFNEYIDT